MGYYSSVYGRIMIDPPLTAPELREIGVTGTASDYGRKFIPEGQNSLRVVVQDEYRDTDEGRLTIMRGVSLVVAYEEEFRAHTLEQDLGKLVDRWLDRLSGVLVVSGEDQGDVWRLVVTAGEVVREDAFLTWPGGADASPKTWPERGE